MFAEHRSIFRNPLSSRVTRRPLGRRHHHHPYQSTTFTWSHKFFCLAAVGARTVPMSKAEKETLGAIGLGEKVLSLPCNSSAIALYQLLVETFPPLSSCGGYALLRCTGKTKTLEIIEPPPGGHSPLSLSSVAGQSRVYVRPLQRDVPLLPPNIGGGVTEVSVSPSVTSLP